MGNIWQFDSSQIARQRWCRFFFCNLRKGCTLESMCTMYFFKTSRASFPLVLEMMAAFFSYGPDEAVGLHLRAVWNGNCLDLNIRIALNTADTSWEAFEAEAISGNNSFTRRLLQAKHWLAEGWPVIVSALFKCSLYKHFFLPLPPPSFLFLSFPLLLLPLPLLLPHERKCTQVNTCRIVWCNSATATLHHGIKCDKVYKADMPVPGAFTGVQWWQLMFKTKAWCCQRLTHSSPLPSHQKGQM